MNVDRIRLLTKISEMYYIEGLNQQEITARLHISRPQISRLLTEAREIGIVKITVENPFSEESEYAERLKDTFGLQDAVVIDTSRSDQAEPQDQVKKAAADYFLNRIEDGQIVAVSPGSTIYGTARMVSDSSLPNCCIVPSSGGWGNSGNGWQANNTAVVLADKLQCRNMFLTSPSLVLSEELHDSLMQEPAIREELQVAESADLALLGVGQVDDMCTILKSGSISAELLEEIKEKGGVASYGCAFLNEAGEEITFSLSNNFVGLKPDQVSKIPLKIIVAYGEAKVKAIRAVLNGKRADTLVTDLETAKALLS